MLSRRGREVVRRIHGEKSGGLEHEPDIRGRHDGVIFRPWEMRVAEGVPEDQVGVFDRTVLSGPAAETVAAAALIGIVAAGKAFIGMVRRHPNMMVDEAGPLAPPGVWRG